ncbi:MAG: hypothetical protein IPP91_01105 [Betaproteobacteria bacterium]|nr:hypothetical protein [Betaproteobacteria bacterium]
MAPVTVMTPVPAVAVTTPVPLGQLAVTFGVPAITTLAGSVSVKVIPACAGLPAPFASVKVSVEVPPWLIVAGENAFVREACVTVSVWFVTPFNIPAMAVTWAAPFTYAPAVLLVTFTVIVQTEAPMAALTPVPPTVIVPVPAVAVIVGVPPQPFTRPLGVPITAPAGSASVKVRPVRTGAPAGLLIVKVRTEFCPTPTVVGLNAFVSVGSACTVRVELTPEVSTRCVAEMLPALVLL